MKNITFWVVVTLIEVSILILYRVAQPECEPCSPGADCPPCISNWQIAFIITGVLVLIAAFLLKKFRPTISQK